MESKDLELFMCTTFGFLLICMLFVGKDAENAFRNLRNRYSRDKKKINRSKVSGSGADAVKTAKKEASELFSFLKWLDPYVQQRNSSSNLILVQNDSDVLNETSDADELESNNSAISTDGEKQEVVKSSVTGQAKYLKRKNKEDIDKAELEFMKTIGDRLERKDKKAERDEESIFGELIASQLHTLPQQERIMAKMELSNAMYSHILKSNRNPTNIFPSESTTGQMSQEPTQHPSHTAHVPSLGLTEMQTVNNPSTFYPGYFFHQHKSSGSHTN